MPLFNNPEIYKAYQARIKKESGIDDLETVPSDRISLVHDEGAVVKTSLNEEIIWEPYNLQIGAFINCKDNPPFPKAHAGNGYLVIGAGRFGTIPVVKGDILIPLIDVEESKKPEMAYFWTLIPYSGIHYVTQSRVISKPLSVTLSKDRPKITFRNLPPIWNRFTMSFLDEVPKDFTLNCQIFHNVVEDTTKKAVPEDVPIDIPSVPQELSIYPENPTEAVSLRFVGENYGDLRVKITIIPGI